MKKRNRTKTDVYKPRHGVDDDFKEDLPDYIPDRSHDGWSEIEEGCFRKIIEPCEY